jgi:hypothetical protein
VSPCARNSVSEKCSSKKTTKPCSIVIWKVNSETERFRYPIDSGLPIKLEYDRLKTVQDPFTVSRTHSCLSFLLIEKAILMRIISQSYFDIDCKLS